jgi:hypothetical protein
LFLTNLGSTIFGKLSGKDNQLNFVIIVAGKGNNDDKIILLVVTSHGLEPVVIIV